MAKKKEAPLQQQNTTPHDPLFRLLRGHLGSLLYTLALPGDGLASVSADGGIRVWDLETGEANPKSIYASVCKGLYLAPDGESLLCVGGEYYQQRINLENLNQSFQSLEFPTDQYWCTAPLDGYRCAALRNGGNNNAVLSLWDLEQKTCVSSFSPMPLSELGFSPGATRVFARLSPGGHFLALSCLTKDSGTLSLFDLREERLLFTRHGPQSLPPCFIEEASLMQPEGDRLLLLQAQDGLVRNDHEPSHPKRITSFSFSLELSLVLTGDGEGMLRLWEARTGLCQRTLLGHQHAIQWTLFLPQQNQVASFASDGELRLWSLSSGETSRRWTLPNAWTGAPLVSRTERFLVAGVGAGIGVLDLEEVERPIVLQEHTSPIRKICLSPDERYAASQSASGEVILWDVPSCRFIKNVLLQPYQEIVSLLSPEKALVVISHSGPLTLVDLSNGRELLRFLGTKQRPTTFARTPDDRLLCASDNKIFSWNLLTGAPLSVSEAPKVKKGNVPRWTEVLPSAEVALSSYTDGTWIVWEIASKKILRTFEKLLRPHYLASSFSRDGKLALAGNFPKSKVWSLETGKSVSDVELSSNLSPSGKLAVSQSYKEVSLSEVSSGNLLARWSNSSDVNVVAVLDDGRLIVGDNVGRISFLRYQAS